MKVAVHQPNYLPGLNGHGSFWSKAREADTFILLDTVQFSPHSYTCRALIPNGRKRRTSHDNKFNRYSTPWLTIPCQRPHMQAIKDILIEWHYYRPKYQLQTILNKTKLSQHRYDPWLNALNYAINCKEDQKDAYSHLADWNTLIILKLAEELGVKCQWRRASQVGCKDIVDILDKTNATTYLTGPSWRKYYPDLDIALKADGIELEELK